MDATIDRALLLLNQFVQAALPVAKKAYEMGLTTLQIDAAQSILIGLIGLVVSLIFQAKARKAWKEGTAKEAACKSEYERKHVADSEAMVFWMSLVVGIISGFVAIIQLCNIWVWIKLVNPQLWLVHTAIQKVL